MAGGILLMVFETIDPFEATELQPIGVFAILGLDAYPERATRSIRPLVGSLDAGEAALIAGYLRGGAMALAWMGYTRDLLGDAFGVSGGTAIVSDGSFFWRYDTADYVEHYRVALPRDFLDHGRQLAWEPRQLSAQDARDIETYLSDYYQAGFDTSLWPDNE